MRKYPEKTVRKTMTKGRGAKALRFSIVTAIVFVTLMTVFALPVFAGGINVEPIKGGINEFGEVLKGFAVPICILVVIISGLATMTGQQGRQWAKPTMLWAGIGLVVTLFSANVVESLNTSFGG